LLLAAAIGVGATCDSGSSGQPSATATSRSSAVSPATNVAPSTAAGSSQPDNSNAPPASPKTRLRPADRGLYIALGDSLSAGIGASDASKMFVQLVDASLGSGMELLNLGVPGATSQDLLDGGKLDQAVAEITRRNGDTDPNNDVQLVTLEIGGNDLLHLFSSLVLTGVCPDVETGFAKPECNSALRTTLDQYRPNLAAALDKLRAADPSLPVLLSTQYNPLEALPRLGDLGVLSLEGMPNTQFPEGLNDIIRQVAQGRDDVTVVDMYQPFLGRTLGLISPDFIHPNDAGYQVMADAEISAIASPRAR
jgi:lysophospholipase L1-like esterase